MYAIRYSNIVHYTVNCFKIIFFLKKCYKSMAIDLIFKVPLLLRSLIAIEKGARHFEFDFEMIFFLQDLLFVLIQLVGGA